MTALLLSENSDAIRLSRRSLAKAFDITGDCAALDQEGRTAPYQYDERWLQELLFRHPELLLVDTADHGVEVAPLCRELPIARPGGNVFLDILGITKAGRLVLVECKLWRNPQARREVVAQILEYAALLRDWSFSDLTARLKQKLSIVGVNPIYAAAKAVWPRLDEATFVDAASRSLALGDFHLVIAGDGIRSDLHQVASYLNHQVGGLSRLSLLEIQLWQSSSGQTIVVPTVPFKTEIVQQRVIVTPQGVPLQLEDPLSEHLASSTDQPAKTRDPERVERKKANRDFWQSFIDTVQFDHPDQPRPRHGGDNWVKIELPGINGWLTAFRSTSAKPVLGLFLRLKGEEGFDLYQTLVADLDVLRSDSGLDLTAEVRNQDPFEADLGVYNPLDNSSHEERQLVWLRSAANRMVTALRPILAKAEKQPV